MRLIDADALYLKFINADWYDSDDHDTAEKHLLDAPTVSLVEAEWQNGEKDEYPHCTNCDYMPMYDPHIDDIYYSPYCPNCGAKMEGDKA